MELLLGAMVVALLGVKAWGTARTEHELAKRGTVPPRMEAKYGAKAAAAKVEAYGFTDYLRDAWHDYWGRRGDALTAARNAEPAPGRTKVRLRDRIAAAGVAVTGAVKDVAGKVAASPVVRKLIDPVETKPTLQPAVPTPEPLAVNSGDVPEGTRRYTDHGQEEYRDGQWRPVPKQPDTFGAAPAKPAGGGAMTAPTGEATNYETTVAELEALAGEQRAHLERCEAALQQIESAKASIGDMQESYRASSAAAASTAEHLAARNLDGVTLANAGTTADAMPAGKVDVMFDQLEMMEGEAKARRDDAEVALGATEANLAHIQATYGDAHATVAGNLSGDASFLDGGGAGAVRNAAGQPVGSPRLQQARSDAAAAGRDGGQRAYDRAMGDHGYTPEGSAPPGSAGRGTPTVRVYDEPVDARGAHFGSTVHGGGVGGAGSTANVFNDEVVRD